MKLTYTLFYLFLFSKNVISQRAVIQDTFYYKKGEMIVGKMYEERNMDKLSIYVKTPEGKSKKINPYKVMSYVRGGTNERYVRLKAPKLNTDKPFSEKAFFRELLKDTNGISVYWADFTQPQFGRTLPIIIIIPTPVGTIVGVEKNNKYAGQSYYYMKEGELFRVEEDDKKYPKLLKKLANDCPNIQENVDKKIYSSKDIWKFVNDFNAGCK
jgi:hypothetical protein